VVLCGVMRQSKDLQRSKLGNYREGESFRYVFSVFEFDLKGDRFKS
jgi:hypothetical protein